MTPERPWTPKAVESALATGVNASAKLVDPRLAVLEFETDPADYALAYSTCPPFPWPTHTCLALPFAVQNRRIMLVASEDAGRARDFYPALLGLYDITDEQHPAGIASYQVEGIDGTPHTIDLFLPSPDYR